MTDIKLKKHLKKLATIFVIVIIVIIALAIYIVEPGKTELSIYTNGDSDLRIYGIDEDEFVEYLSIVGFIANEDSTENKLNLATRAIDTLCSSYEAETLEDGTKKYDMDIINNVLKEFLGDYIKGDIENSEYYEYNREENSCIKKQEPEKSSYCIEIKNIEKNDDEFELEYKLAMMTASQKAEFDANNDTSKIETKNIKVSIVRNTNYEYSKYFFTNVEVN